MTEKLRIQRLGYDENNHHGSIYLFVIKKKVQDHFIDIEENTQFVRILNDGTKHLISINVISAYTFDENWWDVW